MRNRKKISKHRAIGSTQPSADSWATGVILQSVFLVVQLLVALDFLFSE
jgi:hypothetical protein